MSGTASPSDPKSKIVSEWGAVIVSLVALAAYVVALVLAKVYAQADIFNTLCGVAAANATTVISYWVGSSFGSAKKTDTIAAIATGAPPPVPAPPATPPTEGPKP